MITRISGILLEKKAPILTIDVQGIGYEIQASMSTFYTLPETGSAVTLLTHFIVREDAQLLFGFNTERERTLFRALIKVNGVGPKLALTILSGMDTEQFIQCIQTQNMQGLTHIPGIGKKTAERLIIEMRDALSQWEKSDNTLTPLTFNDPNQAIQDAISALVALGYKPNDAKNAVKKVHEPDASNEKLIRLALQQMVRAPRT